MLPGNLRTHGVVVFLLGISSLAQTPQPPFSDPASPAFIVRLQRTQSDKNVCAIVRGDGLFHVESETTNHFELSEGTLDDAELADLKAALSNSDLAALRQKKITSPLVMTEKDEFVLSILRSPLTHDLVFMDRESRRPLECAKNWVRWHHDHTQEFVLIGSKTDADAWNARCVGTRSALTHPPSAELMNERNTRFEFTNSEALYRELLGPLLHKGWHTFDTD
jgi:hypothetical protein